MQFSWLHKFRNPTRRRTRKAFWVVEELEQKTLLTTDLLTAANPAFYGQTGNGNSGVPAVSSSGNVIAFESDATNLLPDSSQSRQIYAYDQSLNTLSLVTAKLSGGGASSGGGINPVVSPDGRYVLFSSSAKDLVSQNLGTDFGRDQLFLRDLQTNTTSLVSVTPDGASGGNSDSGGNDDIHVGGIGLSLYAFSGNSRFVVFWSRATNLVSPAPANPDQLYIRDLQTNVTELVSVGEDGNPAGSSSDSFIPYRSLSVSDDGRYVSFSTRIKGLVVSDVNSNEDVFLRDTIANSTVLVSAQAGVNAPGNGVSEKATMTADGSRVFFLSTANNLVAGATVSQKQLYVRDIASGVTSLVSAAVGNPAQGGNQSTYSVSISRDGRFVAFDSVASNLVPGDTNDSRDVFLLDTLSQETTVISSASNGGAANDDSKNPLISGDGSTILFGSFATNLISGFTDNNSSFEDSYVFDRLSGTTRLLTRDVNNSSGGGDSTEIPSLNVRYEAMSDNGSTIAFRSFASNLITADNNRALDVFLNTTSGTTALSRRSSALPAAFAVGGKALGASTDGRYILLQADRQIVVNGNAGLDELYLYDTFEETVSHVPGSQSVSNVALPQMTPDGRYITFITDDVNLYDRQSNTTELISETPVNESSTGFFFNTVVSADGRYVAFRGNATDLVPGFVTSHAQSRDLYLRDRQTGETKLLNHKFGTIATSANAVVNQSIQISADGRRVFFATEASDLGANDTNGPAGMDIYAYDVASSNVFLVSATTTGVAAGASPIFSVSADGRYVAFSSENANLLTGVAVQDGLSHIYVRDLETGLNRLVDVNTTGGVADDESYVPQMTPDGRFVLFQSSASDLTVGNPDSFGINLFVRDLSSNQTKLVNVTPDGMTSGNDSTVVLAQKWLGQFSPNGRYVAFETVATDLVSGFVDGNSESASDLFLRDLQTGVTQLVSRNRANTASGNGQTTAMTAPFIALDDGRVIFTSFASDLAAAVDTNNEADAFLGNPFVPNGATIRGTVFDDVDGDGTRDQTEDGVFSAVIYIDSDNDSVLDGNERTVSTNLDGTFSLTGVPIGNHVLRQQVGSETQLTFPAAGSYSVVVNEDGEVFTARDFGNRISRPDLVVTGVTSTSPTAIEQTIDVTWTVTNDREFATLVPDWEDAVYLSSTPVLGPDAIFLTAVSHSGNLAGGGSYQGHATVPLNFIGDPLTPHYVIVQSDRRRVVVETSEDNNTSASAAFTIQIPELAPGSTVNGQFGSEAEAHYYRLTGAPGETLKLSLDAIAANSVNEVYVRRGALPSRWLFDVRAELESGPDHELLIPIASNERYYVLVYSAVLPPGADGRFTLSSEVAELELSSSQPAVGDRGGPLTLHLQGAKFVPGMTVKLVAGLSELTASEVVLQDSTSAFVTFNLPELPVGVYDIVLQTGGTQSETVRLDTALTVTESRSDDLSYTVTSSALVRVDRNLNIFVSYKNEGTHDLPVPTFLITSEPDVPLHVAGSEGAPQFGSILVQAVGSSALPGILRAGESGVIRIIGKAGNTAGEIHSSVERIIPDMSAALRERFLGLLTGGASTGEAAEVSPAPPANTAVEPSEEEIANLGFKETFMRAVALAMYGVHAPHGGALLTNFLGGLGPDSGVKAPVDFGPDSPLAQKVREVTDVKVSFEMVNDITTDRVKLTLEDAAANGVDASELEGFEFPVERLQFYGRDIIFIGTYRVPNLISSILLPGFVADDTLDLRLTFGATQKGMATLRNVNLPEKHGVCEAGTDQYEVTIEYKWSDRYDFGLNDIGGGDIAIALNSFALELQNYGWATGFDTSVTINEDLKWEKLQTSNPAQCTRTSVRASLDPNDITGYLGYGDQQWIRPEEELPYLIRFENDPLQATAAVQEVVITHQLDADLDWSSFELGDAGFGAMVVDVPDGLQTYQTRVNYHNEDGSPLLVDVNAGLNLQTGIVTWSFRSVDPATGTLPDGVFDGFLPVDDETGRGEGYASYLIRPKVGLSTGTSITQQAAIVFDTNQPVLTNIFANTIDNGPPASSVAALAAVTNLSTILVNWSGQDDQNGAGIAYYDVYVSTDGGPFLPFLLQTGETSATFDGQFGHTYSFSSVATDNVGHRQTIPVVGQASTVTVLPSVPPVARGESFVILEKTSLDLNAAAGVLGNDSDDNEDSLTASVVAPPQHGTFELKPDGSFTYVPVPGYLGTDQFTYKVSDGTADSNVATVSITVNAAVDEVPQLAIGGGAATWIKKQPPVTVLPAVTVGANAILGGGTLMITVNAIGKRKSLDLYSLPSLATVGTSAGFVFANGKLTLQIQLGANVTANAVQTYLRGIKFSTKGAGLRALTRTFRVDLTTESGATTFVSQTINVRKKP